MTPTESEWAHLSAFKQQAIVSALRLGGRPGSPTNDRPHGLAIKRDLEVMRGDEVNHGRLYPNLSDLVRNGYMAKGEIDKRTNGYAATEKTTETFATYLTTFVGIPVDPEEVPEYAEQVYGKTTTKQ